MGKANKKFVRVQNYSNIQLENFWDETLRLERLIEAQSIYSDNSEFLNVFIEDDRKIIERRMKYVNIPNYFAFFYRVSEKSEFSEGDFIVIEEEEESEGEKSG